MEEVRSILSLHESASQKELEEKLKSLKVDELQLLCKETGVKHSGRKVELIGQLLTNWQLEFDFSKKAKKVYVVHLVVKKSGDVLSASCTCVAGNGEACSHIAALMFYLEDFMRQGHSDLPTDTAATACSP